MDRSIIFPRSLEYLMAIAKYCSFTQAAEALHVSQPTLSQQIKLLEESIGSPLLDRSGKKIVLTNAGQIYIYYVQRAWSELSLGARAVHEVKDLSRGSLRVGWTPITDYLTCSLLEDFNNLYPGITLSTLEMPQSSIETALNKSKIDIGIVFSTPLETTSQSENIDIHKLFEETLCLAVGNSNPLAGKTTQISASMLGEESLVLLNSNFALRDHIDEYCLEHAIMPHIAIETNSLSVIIEMVHLGTRASILPISIVEKQNGLYPIDIHPELPRKVISLIRQKGVNKSPACLAFSKLAETWSYRRSQELQTQNQPLYLSSEVSLQKAKVC
ncbi:MAG: transcriptional regulator CynR [Gammaproteobacteria bacterium]